MCEGKIASIPCSQAKVKVDEQLQRTKGDLTSWIHNVSQLQSRYHWLLYFNMPKLLQLYKLLHNPVDMDRKERSQKILHEISFLVNSSTERENLLDLVKVIYLRT